MTFSDAGSTPAASTTLTTFRIGSLIWPLRAVYLRCPSDRLVPPSERRCPTCAGRRDSSCSRHALAHWLRIFTWEHLRHCRHAQTIGSRVVDRAKEKERKINCAPLICFLQICFLQNCCSSLLQTVRVGLHTGQQICRLMNQVMCNAVRNRCALEFGSFE